MSIQLESRDVQYLQELVADARQPWPCHWQTWFLRGMQEPLGLLSPERAEILSLAMPQHMPLVQMAKGWIWHADTCSPFERSHVLQSISQNLHRQGRITGWRNETYACWGWLDTTWPYAGSALFRLERAAFRYFGLRSHAAHVHGITLDGRMWCGRRSLNKATDPGLLDNLAAGGLPADEQPIQCALREIYEEAGLRCSMQDFSLEPCEILTERHVDEGWHSERLFVYSLAMQNTERPSNRDGEVSEFLCLGIPEIMMRLRDGQFTPDAACAIAKTMLQDFRLQAAPSSKKTSS